MSEKLKTGQNTYQKRDKGIKYVYECPISEIPIYLLLDSEAIIAINKFMRSLEAFNISLHVKGFAIILVFKM